MICANIEFVNFNLILIKTLVGQIENKHDLEIILHEIFMSLSMSSSALLWWSSRLLTLYVSDNNRGGPIINV